MTTISKQKGFGKIIRAFQISYQYVLDFLTTEVLANLPEESHQFLLQTSILKQLSAPLCQAVTGSSNSAELLSTLARKNLFLIPLDTAGDWYRFHHLFAEMLRMRLERLGAKPSPNCTCGQPNGTKRPVGWMAIAFVRRQQRPIPATRGFGWWVWGIGVPALVDLILLVTSLVVIPKQWGCR